MKATTGLCVPWNWKWLSEDARPDRFVTDSSKSTLLTFRLRLFAQKLEVYQLINKPTLDRGTEQYSIPQERQWTIGNVDAGSSNIYGEFCTTSFVFRIIFFYPRLLNGWIGLNNWVVASLSFILGQISCRMQKIWLALAGLTHLWHLR